jgi:hypothetical protein
MFKSNPRLSFSPISLERNQEIDATFQPETLICLIIGEHEVTHIYTDIPLATRVACSPHESPMSSNPAWRRGGLFGEYLTAPPSSLQTG